MNIDTSGLKQSMSLQTQSSKKLSAGNTLGGMTDSISAENSFEANSKVVQAKDEMLGTLLDLKA
ncbi:MAG: hypothetical protein KC646_10665 [Candidatus Cloacimonetes bacterium]|nr:hypothetical protein [Candidatus Cloacimonadota bacterium]